MQGRISIEVIFLALLLRQKVLGCHYLHAHLFGFIALYLN